MEPITLRLEEDTLERVEDEADEEGLKRAEYLREIVANRNEHEEIRREYEEKLSEYEEKLERLRAEYESELNAIEAEYQERIDDLKSEIDDLEMEIQRVHREKRQILEQREEHTELVKQVEQERSLAERKAQAGILTRTKWLITGMPAEE